MTLLLNWRIWVALALAGVFAFSNFTSYRKGRHDVQATWDAAVATANAEARRLEQARQRRADEAAALAAQRESRIRADAAGARRERDGMRDDIDAIQRASSHSLATANNAVRTLGDVLQQCTAEYQRVAEEADRATSESRQLRQAWPGN